MGRDSSGYLCRKASSMPSQRIGRPRSAGNASSIVSAADARSARLVCLREEKHKRVGTKARALKVLCNY